MPESLFPFFSQVYVFILPSLLFFLFVNQKLVISYFLGLLLNVEGDIFPPLIAGRSGMLRVV